MSVNLRIVFVAGTLLLSGCGKNQWEGFVYFDKNDLSRYENIGVFDRLQPCRSAAWQRLLEADAVDKGFYECGMNCEDSLVSTTLKQCEKRVR